MQLQLTPADLIGMVKRRFFWCLIPFLILMIIGLFVIKSLPAVYQSTARLIVEDQQISNQFVQSAVTSDAYQRIEAVIARTTARDSLLLLADELNLFREPGQTITQRYRKIDRAVRISVSRIASTRRRNDPSAIIVTISFRSKNPAEAQRVTNRLLSAFLERNIAVRNEIVETTALFLQDEEAKIRRSLDRTLTSIARIKQESPNVLPENGELYRRSLERASAELLRIDNSIESTQQELRILQMQRPIILRADATGFSGDDELRVKRRQLDALQRQYQDNYPDVIALKAEVLALEKDIDPESFRRRAQEELRALQTQINDAERGSSEFDILVERRDRLRADLRDVPAGASTSTLSEVQYETQLATLESRLDILNSQREAAAAQIADFEARLTTLPAVESRLYPLLQEQQQLEADLIRLRSDRSEAELSASIEGQSMGERLTTLEQPTRPDTPVSPNKPQLAILVFGVAGLVALIIGLVPEILFAKVRSRDHLQTLLQNIKVVEVPRFIGAQSRTPQRLLFASLTSVSIVLSMALSFMAYQTFL